MKLYKIWKLSMLFLFTGFPAAAMEQIPVDTELQLLLDVSGSVDNYEYQLQLDGYVDAFNNYELQQTILSGDLGSIAVQMIMWSGEDQQEVMIDWVLIDSTSDAVSFSELVANLARPFSGFTAIGEAINYSYNQFASNEYLGSKNIIDVSGDGINNQGMAPSEATSLALDNGVDTINGIAITTNDDVEQQYLNEVIGGDNAFVLVTTDFTAFKTSIDKKLIAEISGTVPIGAVQINEPLSGVLFLASAIFLLARHKKALKENEQYA